VSLAALYLTVLQPASILLEYADEGQPGVRGPDFTGAMLSFPQRLTIAVFAANVGNHGGVLTRIEVNDLVYEGTDPPLWTWVAETGQNPPGGCEAGDVLPGNVTAQLGGDPLTTPEEVADRLRGLTSIRVTVRWTFVRTTDPMKALLTRRTTSEPVTRSFDLTLDCLPYRREVLTHWRHRKDTHYLIERAGATVEELG